MTLQYTALDILVYGSYVRSYLRFFYLNKAIFAILDVSSLHLQNVKLLWKFFTIINIDIAHQCLNHTDVAYLCLDHIDAGLPHLSDTVEDVDHALGLRLLQ